MKLTKDEWNVLNKIATVSKMDCWFSLKEKDSLNDVVYDREHNEELALHDGIIMLDTDITDLRDYDLDLWEMKIYYNLLSKVLLDENDWLNTILYNVISYCEGCGVDIKNQLDEIGLPKEKYETLMEFGG